LLEDMASADDRVARELYPTTLAQARREVLIQVLVLAAFVAFFVITGYHRQFAWMVAAVAPGLIATVRDVRWWLWLRHADPVEANRRLQAREIVGSPTASSRAAFALTVVLILAWWFLGP
jgi:hypothetical protein